MELIVVRGYPLNILDNKGGQLSSEVRLVNMLGPGVLCYIPRSHHLSGRLLNAYQNKILRHAKEIITAQMNSGYGTLFLDIWEVVIGFPW